MQWRIGDGCFVQIFHDQWLPHPSHVRVLSPNLDCCPDAKVSSLIDHELCCQKTDVVGRGFLLFEANLVKAIPLSLSRKSNDIFQPRTQDGVYLVKTGYKLLMEGDELVELGASDIEVIKGVSNKIWHLQVPNRVLSLLWRARSDSSYQSQLVSQEINV